MLNNWEIHNFWPYPVVNHHISYQQKQKGFAGQHLNWGYWWILHFLDALKWGNGEHDQPINHWILVFPLFRDSQRCLLHDPSQSKNADDWIPGLTFGHWDGWTRKIYSENSLILSHIYFWYFLIAFSDQKICLTWRWGGKNCVLQPKMCRLPVKRPHEFGTKSPCVILLLDGVDQTGWKCWILQELYYCSMNNRSEEALWWNKPAANLVLGILPKLLLHFGKETVLIDADSFYESLTFADANSKWECDFIWSS